MASRSRSFIQLPSDPDLLLQCIDGAESDDSDSDFKGYIDEEALADLLQRDLINDDLTRQTSESLVLQCNSSAPPSQTGSSFLAPPIYTGKMILHTMTYKIIIIVVHPLVATTPATAMPSSSTIATASLPTGKTRQYQ